jgi:hypothetical protein
MVKFNLDDLRKNTSIEIFHAIKSSYLQFDYMASLREPDSEEEPLVNHIILRILTAFIRGKNINNQIGIHDFLEFFTSSYDLIDIHKLDIPRFLKKNPHFTAHIVSGLYAMPLRDDAKEIQRQLVYLCRASCVLSDVKQEVIRPLKIVKSLVIEYNLITEYNTWVGR